MNFFGALDTAVSLPSRAALSPREDNRSGHVCRTLGDFAVYMHDFGLEHFDVNFRRDGACWNGTDIAGCYESSGDVERGYTWWCNKRPNNPCVFNCPTQVEECTGSSPGPKSMYWQTGEENVFPRWPNLTSWPSAWDIQTSQNNSSHIVPYFIPSGWITNLVTNWWELGRTNNDGQQLYGGDYWFEGSKRVQYDELTIEPGSYTIPGIPDGRSAADVAYFNDIQNEHHYWSVYPTNETITYNTSFRVWSGFTTYVTHLSNHQATLDCHVLNVSCNASTQHSGGRFEQDNILQCPFQFRCFTTESSAGSPSCHRRFPDDYLSTEQETQLTKVHSARDALPGH